MAIFLHSWFKLRFDPDHAALASLISLYFSTFTQPECNAQLLTPEENKCSEGLQLPACPLRHVTNLTDGLRRVACAGLRTQPTSVGPRAQVLMRTIVALYFRFPVLNFWYFSQLDRLRLMWAILGGKSRFHHNSGDGKLPA